jgi:hypothetical protein
VAKTERRSTEEVVKLVREIDSLVAGGMPIKAAAAKVDLSEAVYRRHKKGDLGPGKGHGGHQGVVRADSLPPRPKKGGKRAPKPVNLHDVASLASRISRIDNKLRGVDALKEERESLAGHLMTLLKPKK